MATALRLPPGLPLVTRGDTWTGLLYVLLGAPLGLLWLAVLGTGFLVGGATAVLGVGLVLLLGTLALARGCGELERRLANGLLGAGIAAPVGWPPVTGPAAVARRLVTDPRTWRSVGWLLFRAGAGVPVLAGAVAAAVALVALLVLPFRDGYLAFGSSWRSQAGWASAWALPVGLAGLAGCLALSRVLAGVHRRVAQVLLAPDAAAEVATLTGEIAGAAERARLARDLHDSVGHSITLAVVQADAAAAALAADPAFVARALAEIGAAGRRALDELDTALAMLRDDGAARRPEPTVADLPGLVERARAAGLPVSLHVAGDGWERAASAAAYRVVQEGLTNVLRHVGPVPTVVTVDGSGGRWRVEVRNERGPGGPGRPGGEAGWPAREPGWPGGGRGLAGLRERVRQLGGTLRAGPADGGGWSVEAVLPGAAAPGRTPSGTATAAGSDR